MFGFGVIVGGLGATALAFILWMLHTVIGGLTRRGEYRTQWAELWRQSMGQQLDNAAVRREARRLNAVDRERQRLNEQEAARAQR